MVSLHLHHQRPFLSTNVALPELLSSGLHRPAAAAAAAGSPYSPAAFLHRLVLPRPLPPSPPGSPVAAIPSSTSSDVLFPRRPPPTSPRQPTAPRKISDKDEVAVGRNRQQIETKCPEA